MTDNKSDVQKADMLLFSAYDDDIFPAPAYRHPDQVWAFFSVHSPQAVGSDGTRYSRWNHLINWTLTYRRDSDIVLPYGEFRPVDSRNSQVATAGDVDESFETVRFLFLCVYCIACSYNKVEEFSEEKQHLSFLLINVNPCC
jgi:hypothetical protein